MTINSATLRSKLQTELNSYVFRDPVTTDEATILALSTFTLGNTNVFTVDDVGNLPSLEIYDSPDAMICFIADLDVFAISSNKRWITLDGRFIRDDTGRAVSLTYGWGVGGDGQLGNGTITNRSSPVSVVGFTDWCQVSAGGNHSLAVRTNGSMWAWGAGFGGQLGDGTEVNKSLPVSVVGGFSDWISAIAGNRHSLGVRQNGTLWAWGNAAYGRLGNNLAGFFAVTSPVSVVGGFTDWCQASAGGRHSLGVRQNGTLWAWGSGVGGRLGDNTIVSKASPVSVVGGFTDWCQASASLGEFCSHNVGVRSNGTLWAWGSNHCGQLGDNSTVSKSSPVSVVGGFTDWCQASAAFNHSLGIRSNGTLWAWGCNGYGRLGDNTTVAKSSPVSVVGGFTDWCQVSSGGNFAVRSNGTLWAWGYNGQGQLGDGTTVNKSSPVSVIGGFTDWCFITSGGIHSLGIVSKC